MVIESEFEVKACREEVWNFLMDTESLARCLPGCEEVKDIGNGIYQAVAAVKIAFMKLKFNLNVRITDMNAPEELSSEVDGKPMSLVGQLKMKAKMNLTTVTDGVTQVQYHMDMSLSGKLGSLGQSAFRSKATEMGGEFAQNIRKQLEKSENAETA
ncbi:carbon monoxide dehydrogenase subunit G [Aneurinibacillus sp. Ricciae_BoGa-3]|uniref:CoxG family protein n=1 Tax=Aneurinibacillus sp. Ricciae_BoGa-3 TaxID=3022697 RepID=UPI0023419C90|nr:carbon monoxide dehydrogenase subunit G [Aneurinibacillus sp. Ricciae_BoGa-3]WCK52340.1 carbon monoxide dehydrogenase subunit G [Aneurinibacillus sp. Ricciae_BoGa-3]